MKTENMCMCTLDRKEFDNMLNKPSNYLFFVYDDVVGDDGMLMRRYTLYKGGTVFLAPQGQGVDFQRDGSKVRFGKIPPGGGDTVWDEWVDLKGEKGGSVSIDGDGNWSDGNKGISGYAIDVSPGNPMLDSDGAAKESKLEVSLYRLNLKGQRVSLSSSERNAMVLRASYYYSLGNGMGSSEVEDHAVGAGKLSVDTQKTNASSGAKSDRLVLVLLSSDKSVRYAVKEVDFNRRGEPGKEGVDGGIYVPVWEGDNLGWELVESGAQANPPDTKPIIPHINEDGYWVVRGEVTQFLADVTPALESVGTVSDNIIRLNDRLEKNEGRINTLSQAQVNTANSLSEINKALTSVNQTVSSVNQTVSSVNQTVSRFSEKVSSVESSANNALAMAKSAKLISSKRLVSDVSSLSDSDDDTLVLITGVCYTSKNLDIPDGVDCVIFNIKYSNDTDSFCLGNMMEVKDRLMRYVIRNVSPKGTPPLSFEFSGYDNLYAPKEIPSVSPGDVVELDYLNNSETGCIYVFFSDPMSKYQ